MSDTASSSGTESYWYDSSDEYESESNISFTATDSVYYSSLSVDTSTPSEHWSAVELSPIRPSTPVVTPTKQSSPAVTISPEPSCSFETPSKPSTSAISSREMWYTEACKSDDESSFTTLLSDESSPIRPSTAVVTPARQSSYAAPTKPVSSTSAMPSSPFETPSKPSPSCISSRKMWYAEACKWARKAGMYMSDIEIAKIDKKAAIRGHPVMTDSVEYAQDAEDRSGKKLSFAIEQYHYAKRQYRFVMLGHYSSTPTKDVPDSNCKSK